MWVCENLKSVYEELDGLIPFDGPVCNVNKNKKLEKLRKAANVVHDIFNNGLMNRGKQLKVLKLKMYDLPLPNEWFAGDWDRVKEIVEPKMEKIILDAAKEQGIKLELVPSATTGKIELEAA